MLLAPAYVSVQASGTVAAGSVAPDDLRNAISAELSGAGLQVRNIVLNAPVWRGSIPFAWFSYPFTLTVVLATRADYASADAVRDLVAQAITDQSGQAPDAITAQTQSADTQSITADQGVDTSSFGSAAGDVRSVFGALQSDAQLIVIAIVVLVALVAFGPNIKDLARAR